MLLLALLALWFGGAPDDVSGESCVALDLVASKTYPSTWSDDVVDLADPITFEVPASLPVTSGGAGTGTAALRFSDGGGTLVECTYIGAASAYDFDHCDDGSVTGSLVTADHFELHVADGDASYADTEVAFTLDDLGCILDDGPCAGGSWGGITWLGNTIHVRSDGDDANDGSAGAPVATLAQAHTLLRGLAGQKAIAVGPGTFDAALRLDDGLLDDDAWIMGCSPAETVLLGSDPTAPVVDLAAPATMGVKSLTVQGGGGGVALRDDATAYVVDVAAVNNGGPGIRLEDSGTLGSLVGVEVTDPTASGCGWGVDVADGTLLMRGTTVTGAQAIGVGVLDGTLIGLDSDITGTLKDTAGFLGRGMHAQDAFTVVLDATLIDNFDAAIFLKDPRGAIISNIVIDFTGAGITANGGTTGDGIVVAGNGNNAQVMVVDNIVFRSDRKALVVEDADVWVGSNISGAGAVKQGVTTVSGPQAPIVVDMTAAPLDLNLDSQSCN